MLKDKAYRCTVVRILGGLRCWPLACYNYNYNYNRDLLCAPYKQNDGALHCHEVLTIKAVLNKKSLSVADKHSLPQEVMFLSAFVCFVSRIMQKNYSINFHKVRWKGGT